ncbi:MAG: hypothetical protein Tsb0021_08360 [Chlamydiales bacterium]
MFNLFYNSINSAGSFVGSLPSLASTQVSHLYSTISQYLYKPSTHDNPANTYQANKSPITNRTIRVELVRDTVLTKIPEEKIKEPSSLKMNDLYTEVPSEPTKRLNIGPNEEELIVYRELGKGGSKIALEVSGNRALLLPNIKSKIDSHINRWPEMVDEEVYMSKYLEKNGLLCSKLEKVFVLSQVNEEINTRLPALITETFSKLKEQGIHVINLKDFYSDEDNIFLFKKPDDEKQSLSLDRNQLYDIDVWKNQILPDLVEDFAKLLRSGVTLYSDSLSIALVENATGYSIRYFGFDFSSKHTSLERPNPLSEKTVDKEQLHQQISKSFLEIMESVLIRETNSLMMLPKGANELLKQLNDYFVDIVLTKVLVR